MLVVQTKKIGASAAFLATLGSDSSVELIKLYSSGKKVFDSRHQKRNL
jgi:hypothetical protein